MSHEVAMAYSFLYGQLSGDTIIKTNAPGGVFRGIAPSGATAPFVIMSFQSGFDVLTANVERLMSQPLMQVKAVGPGSSMTKLSLAAAEIDDVLKRQSGTVTNGLILSCYRESPLQYDEVVNGEMWTHLGGLYRLLIQQTS